MSYSAGNRIQLDDHLLRVARVLLVCPPRRGVGLLRPDRSTHNRQDLIPHDVSVNGFWHSVRLVLYPSRAGTCAYLLIYQLNPGQS